MSVPSSITPPLTHSGSSSAESSPVSNFSSSLLQRSKVMQIVHSKDKILEDDQRLARKSFTRNLITSPSPSPPLGDHSRNHSSRRSSSCSSSKASRSSSPRLRLSRSPGASSPPKGSATAHVPGTAFHTFPRYRPYPSRGDPTPLSLRFAAKTTGPSSHLSMTQAEVNEGKDLLEAALTHFPPRLLQKAYEAKRADRDTIVHRVAQTASEIESLERHRQFLTEVQLHQEGQLAVEESVLGLVKAALSPRDLRDVEDDSGFYRAVFAEELVHLMTAETQLEHIGSVDPAIHSEQSPPNNT